MSENWDKLRARAEELQQQKKLAEAELAWKEALKETDKFDRTDRRTALTLEGLAEVYWHLGRFDDATKCCKRLITIYSEIFGEDQYDVGVIANNLAMLLHVQERYEEAEVYYQQALAIKTQRLGKDHPDIHKLLGNYSNLLRACKRPEDADKLKSGEILITAKNWTKMKSPDAEQEASSKNGENSEKSVDTKSVSTSGKLQKEPIALAVNRWESLRRLAEAAEREHRLGDSEALWAASVRYFEPFGTEDPRRLAYALDAFGDALCQQDKHDMAEPYYRRAVDIKARHLGAQHIVVARSLNNLARLYYQLNRFTEAEPLARKCIDIYEQLYGNEHPDYATALHNLGTLYHIQVRFKDAEPLYRQALSIRQRTLGPDHPETKGLARSLANLLRSTGREEEASKVHGPGTPMITGTWRALAIPEGEQLLSSET